jgi:hypothetical protein
MVGSVRFSHDAPRRPHRCAVMPHITAQASGGYFSTGTTLAGETVYVSRLAVREMAERMGYVAARNRQLQDEQLARLKAERDGARAERDVLQAQLDAVAVLRDAGRLPKKPGRPKKAPEAVAA